MQTITRNFGDHYTKVDQIVQYFANDIEKGVLKKGALLPSINNYSKQHSVARDTIEKAYKELRREGYITSIPGKGCFVVGKKDERIKVLLVLNKMSSYKKLVYEKFIETLGKKAKVDLHIHHYDPRILKEIIDTNLGKYDYYAIMPHFKNYSTSSYLSTLKRIPPGELILLDRGVPELRNRSAAVTQDFKEDIYSVLSSQSNLFSKYSAVTILFPYTNHHPTEILDGVKKFCVENDKNFLVLEDAKEVVLKVGTLYIAIEEQDLAKLIKKIRASPFELGYQLGVISFNESELKELLDITVISTDFTEMGRLAATMILTGNFSQIRNPFTIIRRGSV